MTADELIEQCMTLTEALTEAFGSYTEDETGRITVTCCGPISYGSGIIGSDIVRCRRCGKWIINILSPHVSPLLIQGHSTYCPSEELIERVGSKCWWTVPHDHPIVEK